MSRLSRLLAAPVVIAAALTVAPLAGSLASSASASTASLNVVGAYVYPGKLVYTISGRPSVPYTNSPAYARDVAWYLWSIPVDQACPTTMDDIAQIPGLQMIDSQDPDGATFSASDRIGADVYVAARLCGLMDETDTTGSEVVTTAETLLPARVPHYGLGAFLSVGTTRAVGECADLWPNGKVSWPSGCDLHGTVAALADRKTQHRLGLSTSLIGKATIRPPKYGAEYYTNLTFSKKVQAALKKFSDKYGLSQLHGRIRLNFTAPISWKLTESYKLLSGHFIHSWD